MGIKNLNDFLRKNCPDVFESIHLSEYAYKKIAIDISLFLCKYKAICGDRWVSAFINLVSCLRRNEIHCVFIYDSGSPPEKADEKAERVKQREKNEQNLYEIEIALECYYNTGEINDELLSFYEKIKDKPINRRLLTPNKKDLFDIELIKLKIDKMRSNILNITKEDFDLTKDLFRILNIPFYDAPLEAETTCSDLCKRGIVDAVLSEDTDVLAYSTPIFLTKIDTNLDTCVRLKHNDILNSIEMTDGEFLDLCIMCGCDYNKNIPKIGPQNAYKYLQKYKSIDEIGKNTVLDISVLNHIRTRELFTKYEEINITSIPFCGIPDFEKLSSFIKDNNININVETLKKNFTHNNLIVYEE